MKHVLADLADLGQSLYALCSLLGCLRGTTSLLSFILHGDGEGLGVDNWMVRSEDGGESEAASSHYHVRCEVIS